MQTPNSSSVDQLVSCDTQEKWLRIAREHGYPVITIDLTKGSGGSFNPLSLDDNGEELPIVPPNERARQLGFESMQEAYELLSTINLSDPKEFERLCDWFTSDKTKAGLLACKSPRNDQS